MEPHPYGLLSLAPPVIAIVLAILTRRLVTSMLIGIFVGALLTQSGNPLWALSDFWEVHLWKPLVDPTRLRMFSFTLLMGALIGVISRSGGMRGLIDIVTPWARSRRGGQLLVWLMGMVIFFDDYANCLLLGNTMRPITDKLKISREKLAYIVDSTSAPVAGLAIVSTWVAVEIEYIRSGLLNINGQFDAQAVNLFIQTIPYRFYMWAALLLVPLIAILGRDFGSMLVAERERWSSDQVNSRHPAVNSLDSIAKSSAWYNAVLPIVLTVLLVVYFIYHTGRSSAGPNASINEILSHAQSSVALQYGAFGGLMLAILLARTQKLLSHDEVLAAAAAGARLVAPAILILWCAASMSLMTGNKSIDGKSSQGFEFQNHRLYTGDYLKSVLVAPVSVGQADSESNSSGPNRNSLGGSQTDVVTGQLQARFPLQLLPTIVFLVSCIVAFATGTSWGTMGILMPIVVPMTYALVATVASDQILQHPIMLGTVGSVLAGAIFGDHCSPISDTTVLSSQSSACDHIAHVKTQMPYSLSLAAINIMLGTLPLGLGVSLWLLLVLQMIAIVLVLLLLGRPVESN